MNEFKIESPGNYGGDLIEKLGWPLFGKEKFENYERFWQSFVVPRTNRPTDIHLQANVPAKEREIASIHYSIFHSFYVTYDWLLSPMSAIDKEAQHFEYSFVKLSNACDLIEEMLFKVLVLFGQLDSENDLIANILKKEELNKIITKVQSLTSDEIFEDLERYGAYSIRIVNRRALLRKNFDLVPYISLSEEIRRYRNVIVHSSSSFQLNGRVPKTDYVKKYQDWLNVTDVIKSNDNAAKLRLFDDFVPMRDLIQQQADTLVAIANVLWSELLSINLKSRY